jgi:Fe-S-cluster containining protein
VLPAGERICPLLDAAGRCAVYEARPLGCRTFYCDRAAPGAKVRQPEVNALVRRIQDIAQRHEPDGDRGRLLTRAL